MFGFKADYNELDLESSLTEGFHGPFFIWLALEVEGIVFEPSVLPNGPSELLK